MEPGIYRNLDNEEYHRDEGLSSSGARTLIDYSPLHYLHRLFNPQEPTAAFVLGDAFHKKVEDEDLFQNTFQALPEDFNGRTKAGKELKASIEAGGLITLKHSEYKTVEAMAEAVHTNQAAIDLLSDGEAELSGYWYDPEEKDVLLKLRMDWINNGQRAIVDLKSCLDVRKETFEKDAYAHGYHVQAAWYLNGMTQITGEIFNDFYFVCVEKTPPFGVIVYWADDAFIRQGQIEMRKAIRLYAHCLKADRWPSYEEREDLSLPKWAKRDYSDVD